MAAGTADPIKVVDAKQFVDFDLAKTARKTHQRLKDFARGAREDDWDVRDEDIPSQEVIAGKVSNVRAFLFNEARRAKETVISFSATPAKKDAILRWISSYDANNSTFSQSVAAHQRAAMRELIHTFSEENDVKHFALTVARSAEDSLSVAGVLSEHIGMVRTGEEWLDAAEIVAKGRQGMGLVWSLGFHHNDPTYLMPIPESRLDAMRQVLADYRRGVLKRLMRRRDDGGGP